MSYTLYKKNSQFLEIEGFNDASHDPPVIVNDADANGTLFDPQGVAVPGAVDLTGEYVPSSDGVYHFQIDGEDFDPPAGSGYKFIIDASFEGADYHAELSVRVKVRSKGTEV